MRDCVAQQLVVQLHRLEVTLQGATDAHEIVPPAGRLVLGQPGRLCHVPAAPDHHGVPALDAAALQVRVRPLAGEDANAVTVVLTAVRTERAALSP